MLMRMFEVERNIDRVNYAKPGDPARYGYHAPRFRTRETPSRAIVMILILAGRSNLTRLHRLRSLRCGGGNRRW